MPNFSKYIFAPWVRQGLSNSINEEDQYSGVTLTATERAEIDINLNWTEGTVTKKAQLLGPGDIKSVSEDAILKVSPLGLSRDMESNYLPFIEFYEEDFPWRYTPASPTDNISATDKTKLRPWLALVVLEDDKDVDGNPVEFVFNTPQDELPYITVTGAGGVSSLFHPADDHWAWGHVQYNPETDAAATPGGLVSGIKSDPDRALARILCPRKLSPEKNYRAFLIPAFETGRLAGLGLSISGVLAQKASWGASPAGDRPNDFPVYKEWSFRTSADGDFETLAKKLRPQPFDGDGGRNMAIGNSGYGVHYAPGGRNAKLEGALRPTDVNDVEWPSTGAQSGDDADYISDLSDVLNLNKTLNPNGAAPGTPSLSLNPFSNAAILDDPIISPPLYGQWHFLNNSVPSSLPVTGDDEWFAEVNLNPAWRAAAGLGTKIIRENQEEFMERAWQQVGEINKANELIRLAELVKWTNKRITEKRLDNVPVDRFIKMNSSLMKKVQNGSGKSLQGELRDSELSDAVMDNGFRKMTRARGVIAKKASKSASMTSPGLLTETIISSFKGVQGVATVDEVNSAKIFNPNPAFVSAPPAAATALVTLNATLATYSEPTPVKFKLSGTADSAREMIEKRTDNFYQVSRSDGFSMAGNVSVLDRNIVSQISVLNTAGTAWSPVENRKPIMAYPKFNDVVGDIVKKIDVEYILPEIAKVENNSVTLMETNPKFLESLFLGMNHEMSRELLWREFPTDQRGTYFRQFWDKKDAIGVTDLNDIKEIHNWEDHLGDNTSTGDGGDSLVLVVKGDLLRKFPDAIIYAQKAGLPTIANGGLEGSPGTYKRVENEPLPLDYSDRKYPIFSLTIDPDITIIGFDLDAESVQNTVEIDPNTGDPTDPTQDPGWYFVFAERPGKPRFGLDEGAAGSMTTWSDLTWAELGTGADHVTMSNSVSTPSGDSAVHWATSSAEMAYITFQKPALVAIHAEKMLPNPTP